MIERQYKVDGVTILSDAGLEALPGADWFRLQWWVDQSAVTEDLGGRGTALSIETSLGPAVLRRFRRGGLFGPMLGDRYPGRSADRSRAFREFRLLARLAAMQLPVPQPLAASFEPSGPVYRAALLTRLIPQARQLADVAAALPEDSWRSLGATLDRFFQTGLHHPDLNARNILLDDQGCWHLLDFDRACVVDGRVPRGAMLKRLARSLGKTAGEGWQRGFSAMNQQLI